MLGYAIVHILWLMALPLSLILIVYAYSRKSRLWCLAGVMTFLFSLPAALFCIWAWPIDFIKTDKPSQLAISLDDYQITLINEAGVDFYDTYFWVRNKDEATTRLMVDPDDNKWWKMEAKDDGDVIYFKRPFEKITSKTPRVNKTSGAIVTGLLNHSYKLSELSFDEEWN